MKLSFKAKGDLLVTEPGVPIITGSIPRYVNRKFVAPVKEKQGETVVTVKGACFPAVKEPLEVDSDSKDGARLIKLTRRDKCLWPADAPTAKACLVEYTPTKFADGAWSVDEAELEKLKAKNQLTDGARVPASKASPKKGAKSSKE